jgi:hypothetical protein
MKTKTLGVTAFCLLLVACAAIQPVHVQLNYTPGKNQLKAMSIEGEKANLRITKIDIFDKRVDQEHLGSTDTPIYGTGVIEWVRGGITSLSEFGYSFPPLNEEINTSGLSLKVDINRASCRGTVMNMRCTVCLEAAFLSDGELIQRKSYYGTQSKDKALISRGTRHFGEEAVLGGLNGALEQCLIKFETDLRKLRELQGTSWTSINK